MNRFEYNQPNTRERIAARRRTNPVRKGSAVRPGPRRALGSWLATGRIASLLLLATTLGALLYIATSPRFVVKDIRVEGAQVMSAQAITGLVDVYGQSIWQLDSQQLIARLKTSAYIQHASVYLTLPDRLTIRVDERRPDVRWRNGQQLYLVDAGGLVLGTDTVAPLTDTLVIEDRSMRALKPNDHVDADALKLGRQLVLRLPAEAGLVPAHIVWDTNTGIFVLTNDQRTIVFGKSDNIESKLTILETLLKDGTVFTYLDLRPSLPFYRNEGPATTPTTGPTS